MAPSPWVIADEVVYHGIFILGHEFLTVSHFQNTVYFIFLYTQSYPLQYFMLNYLSVNKINPNIQFSIYL